MKIDRIHIVCCRSDLELARICAASVAHFCPGTPINLFKDLTRGSFDTREIERKFGATSQLASVCGGHGYAKLELLLGAPKERYLQLDADTIITGDLVREVENTEEDFIVFATGDASPESPVFRRLYYHWDRLAAWDPHFRFPGYGFNTGHLVGTSSVVTPADLDRLLIWGSPPVPRMSDTFSLADQGILNYLLPKLAQTGKLSLACRDLALWGFSHTVPFSASHLREGKAPAKVLHWAGQKPLRIDQLPHYDLLRVMEDCYYRAGPSPLVRRLRRVRNRLHHTMFRTVLKAKMAATRWTNGSSARSSAP